MLQHCEAQRDLSALLHDRLDQTLYQEGHGGLKGIEIRSVQRRPYSWTTFLDAISADGHRHRLVLKQVVRHPLNVNIVDEPNQGIVEYNILQQLYPQFVPISRCAVPRPLFALPEIDGFVMRYVEGHILADDLRYAHYWASRRRFGQLQDSFFDCGNWLRCFHTFTRPEPAGSDCLENILARSHDRLRLIEESGDARCPKELRMWATAYLERQLARLSNVEILVTGRHSDFGPWNVVAGPDGVTVLDFFGFRKDPFPVDILSVLVYLESIRYGIANSATRIAVLRKRFLDGYGRLPEMPLALVLLCEAQQRIVQIAATIIGREENFFQRWERTRSLPIHVSWLAEQPERSSLWPAQCC